MAASSDRLESYLVPRLRRSAARGVEEESQGNFVRFRPRRVQVTRPGARLAGRRGVKAAEAREHHYPGRDLPALRLRPEREWRRLERNRNRAGSPEVGSFRPHRHKNDTPRNWDVSDRLAGLFAITERLTRYREGDPREGGRECVAHASRRSRRSGGAVRVRRGLRLGRGDLAAVPA